MEHDGMVITMKQRLEVERSRVERMTPGPERMEAMAALSAQEKYIANLDVAVGIMKKVNEERAKVEQTQAQLETMEDGPMKQHLEMQLVEMQKKLAEMEQDADAVQGLLEHEKAMQDL